MAAVTAPVQVDESLVQFTSSVGTKRLASVLRQLSHNAAVNARVIVSLQHTFEEFRTTASQQHETLLTRLDNETRLRLELEHTVQDQRKRIDKFEKTFALQETVDEHVKDLNTKIQRALSFIQEIEDGSGERVTKFVGGYIQAFVPKWYAGVSGEMMEWVKNLVQESSDDAASSLDRRGAESDEKAEQELLKAQANIFQQLHRLNEERRKEISKTRTEIYDRFTESDNRTDHLIAQSKHVQEKRHSTTRRRLRAIEESACALRTTMCVDDGLCRELHNLLVNHTFPEGDPRCSAAKVSSSAEVVPDEKDADHAVPGEQRGHDVEELFQRLSADDCARDVRVRRVAQTPHFVAQRTMLQKEFSERMDFLKTDLHNDLVSEIFDLQREIRGKVGTNKLGELLDQYRDEGLYANVKFLMQDMNEIKINKVDMVLFVEGLRSKADVRVMDTKVDKTLVTTQIETIERKLDDMVTSTTRTEHRIMRMENQMNAPRRGTVTAIASAPVRHHNNNHHNQSGGDVAPPMIEDRVGSSKGGKLIRGNRRLSAAGAYNSPYRRNSVSPNNEEWTDPFAPTSSSVLRPQTGGSPTTANGNGGGNIQDTIDQMLERGFPAQVVVPESTRDISRLHHSVVKSSHEKQVAVIIGEEDPDVEGVTHHPSVPTMMRVSSSPSSGTNAKHAVIAEGLHLTSPRKAPSSAISTGSTKRQPSAQGAPTVTGSARPTSTSDRMATSSSLTASKMGPGMIGPGMIPMTKAQEAYCAALETDPPQSSGIGFAIGMKYGEKRDY